MQSWLCIIIAIINVYLAYRFIKIHFRPIPLFPFYNITRSGYVSVLLTQFSLRTISILRNVATYYILATLCLPSFRRRFSFASRENVTENFISMSNWVCITQIIMFALHDANIDCETTRFSSTGMNLHSRKVDFVRLCRYTIHESKERKLKGGRALGCIRKNVKSHIFF